MGSQNKKLLPFGHEGQLKVTVKGWRVILQDDCAEVKYTVKTF